MGDISIRSHDFDDNMYVYKYSYRFHCETVVIKPYYPNNFCRVRTVFTPTFSSERDIMT